MLTAEELRAKIQQHKKSGELALYIPGFLTDDEIPGWGDFIEHIEDATHRPNRDVNVNNPIFQRAINSTIVTGMYYFTSVIDDGDREKRFHKLLPAEQLMVESFGTKEAAMAHAFVNLISGDAGAPKHRDNLTDNFFVQCQGPITWRLFRNRGDVNSEMDIRLQPGDAIFVTRDVYHEVHASNPRASIVFRVNVPENEVVPSDQ